MVTGPSTHPFGDLLRRYRLAAGLSQEALAERAALSARGISALERGVNRTPQRETVLRLAEALALSGEERATFVGAARRRSPAQDVESTLPPALPAPLTALVGRDEEVRVLAGILRRREARLVTLTGPGGVGKTRLVLAVAAALAPDFPDGVLFVPLASLRDPGLVLPALAQRLGLRPRASRPLAEEIAAHARAKRLLLVLDNFEHLLPAASELACLLEVCPQLAALVTSRATLHLRGEREVAVEPLATPDPRHALAPDALARYPAVALFVERVRDHRPEFALDAANAGTVAEVCARLDGLPLALELAAEQCRLFSPRALLARLERRLAVLTGGPRDLPARQQTMRATIAWSYDLLSAGEQALLRRLAVFAGGCTLEAIEAICAATAGVEGDVREWLRSLVDKSLVRQTEAPGGEPRFGMLETIREYGIERLTLAGESEAVRRAHALQYLALAEEAEPAMDGPEQAEWLARLDREHDNLRAALRWARERDEIVLGLRLAGALHRFWLVHGHLSEGRARLDGLLGARSDEAGARMMAVRAKALNGAGLLALAQGDHALAIARYEESLALRRELGDRPGIAQVLNNLGLVANKLGDDRRAAALFEESLALRRALGDTARMAAPLNNLGGVALAAGEYARATVLFEESLAIARQIGDPRTISIALSNLSYAAWHMGAYTRATALSEESLVLRRELGDREGIAIALGNLGEVACLQGDLARAAALQAESLALFRELGGTWGVLYCLQRLALVAHALPESRDRAARLFGALAALRATLGIPVPPNEHARLDPALAALRAALGDGAFEAAWTEGRAMSLDQAIALALGIPLEGASSATDLLSVQAYGRDSTLKDEE